MALLYARSDGYLIEVGQCTQLALDYFKKYAD
jgi:hypothetical protein